MTDTNWCWKCCNRGFPDKVCPVCGREPVKQTVNLEQMENVDEFVQKIDNFGVPPQYRGIFWDSGELLRMHPELETNLMFKRFVSNLEKINTVFANGLLSPKSAIIIAPAGFSKMTFAYSCMQRALNNGFTVAPFLDTIELKRLLVLAGENPNYKLFGNVDYDEYIMSDVCFVTVTKMRQREWAYEVLQELIDRRERKGLSTFIISRFSLAEISRRDRSSQFEVISTAKTKNNVKYPAVIRFN